jgi:Tfp pilus assembly protein PilN
MTTPDPHVNPQVTLDSRVEELRQVTADVVVGAAEIKNDLKTLKTWLAGLTAFTALLSLLGLVWFFHARSDDQQDDQAITQLQQQQARMDKDFHEICATDAHLLAFYSDKAKQVYFSGTAAYDQLYTDLQTSADNLQCGIKHVVPGT